MGGAEQVLAFVFVCVYLLVYLYDETGGEREKGGARGLDQIVMKDRGLEQVTVFVFTFVFVFVFVFV